VGDVEFHRLGAVGWSMPTADLDEETIAGLDGLRVDDGSYDENY
jgi:hypothetical protein